MTAVARRGLIAPTVATVAALVVLVSLGTWQWQRKAWKEDLLATLDARIAAAALAPEQWQTLDCQSVYEVGFARSCEFRAVRLTGRFVHDAERHIFTSVSRSGSGPSGPGYWVLTPFEREGAPGSRVYVNRGFVPEGLKDPAARMAGQISGPVEIVGQIRTADPRGLFTNQNSPDANVWYLRNPQELLGIADRASSNPPGWSAPGPNPREFYVEQIAPAPPGGLPAPRPARIEIPNRHLEYALTWWGLALTLVGVYVAFMAGRLRRRPRQI